MKPTEQGAFCKKCAIDVMDFTNKSPFEIRDILSEKFSKKERACGKIRQSQLKQVNEIGVYWRNEKQRFQSVWMVSLLSVFGLSLFSCQNTVSKEIVSNMELEAQELLTNETPKEETLKTEISEVPPLDSIASKHPASQELSIDVLKIEKDDLLKLCYETILLGDFIQTSGMFSNPSLPKDTLLYIPTPASSPLFNVEQPIFQGNEQIERETPRQGTGTRSDVVLDPDVYDFWAYIAPIPINTSSRLIVESFKENVLHFQLDAMETSAIIHEQNTAIKQGSYSFKLPWEKLSQENYEITVSTYKTVQSIQFQWKG